MENLESIIEKREKILKGELGSLTSKLERSGIIVEDYTEGDNGIVWLYLELPSGWTNSLEIDKNNLGKSLYKYTMELDIIDTVTLYLSDNISFRKTPIENAIEEWIDFKNILTQISIQILKEEGYFDGFLLNEDLKIKILEDLGDFFYTKEGRFIGELDYTVNSVDFINKRLVEFYSNNILELKKDKDKKEINKRIIKDLENILNNNI